jgi:hypothetical protein
MDEEIKSKLMKLIEKPVEYDTVEMWKWIRTAQTLLKAQRKLDRGEAVQITNEPKAKEITDVSTHN